MSALMAFVSKINRAKTDGQAGPDVVAESHRAQKACAVDAKFFTGRQGGRNHGAARMRLRELVGVIGFVGMRQHAVDERRFQWTGSHFRGNDRRSLIGCKIAGELKRSSSRRQV